jgi:hypothetical protein
MIITTILRFGLCFVIENGLLILWNGFLSCIGRSRSVFSLKMKEILCFIRINMALRLDDFRKLVKEWAGDC